MQTCQLEQDLELKTAAIEHAGVYQRQNTCLSVSVENAGLSSISLSTLTGMWKKAENLIQSEGHILKAPWLSDKKARLVRSSSSPSLVPGPFEEEKGPGIHCTRMRKVYRAFSSIICQILSLPRGRTRMDNVY